MKSDDESIMAAKCRDEAILGVVVDSGNSDAGRKFGVALRSSEDGYGMFAGCQEGGKKV